MFMGALLLLAAALTWGIGLMMSPHGESVARGTEYLKSTIVTFKRNGATGTLILCGIAAWLLFPQRRPKWPARDWALIALFGFLAGSSIYTLIWLRPDTAGIQQNSAAADMNLDWNASTAVSVDPASINPPPAAALNRIGGGRPPAAPKSNDGLRADHQSPASIAEEQADITEERTEPQVPYVDAPEPAAEENQE
jgi:hypothetical protein